MDLLKLDNVTFYPVNIFENYTTLIWTERFLKYGDFKLKTLDVSNGLQSLPVGSLVSLQDTSEVMIVESHIIEPDSNGSPELTIEGRTFNSFLENRVLYPFTYGESWRTLRDYTPQQYICLLIWDALVNTGSDDPTRLWHLNGYKDPLLVVPNVNVSITYTTEPQAKVKTLSNSTVAKLVQDVQEIEKIGVRAIRPKSRRNETYLETWFDVSRSEEHGTIHIESNNDDTQMRIDVYQGVDRSVLQTLVTPVIFHFSSGHIAKPKFLRSIKGQADYIKVLSNLDYVTYPSDFDSQRTGLDRRVRLIDGGSKNIASNDAWRDLLREKAKLELEKNKKLILADGEISANSPYLYNKDYFLGDTITFAGNYEPQSSMIVSEVVRTEDANGETLSPGLTHILESD